MHTFNKRSLEILPTLHPNLQRVLTEAIRHSPFEFQIICGERNQTDQNKAVAEGRSKAKFGESAHNYSPSCAADCTPVPLNWNDHRAFQKMGDHIMAVAKSLGIAIRWGGDFNRDGDKTTKDSWDKPHFELHPWREVAKKDCKLFGTKKAAKSVTTPKPATPKPVAETPVAPKPPKSNRKKAATRR